jgi:hypothetical protein
LLHVKQRNLPRGQIWSFFAVLNWRLCFRTGCITSARIAADASLVYRASTYGRWSCGSSGYALFTPRLLAQWRVIAKGRQIREVKRLVAQHGGRESKRVKKSSPQIEIADKKIEYHWYEHSGIGRFEIKEVQITQP